MTASPQAAGQQQVTTTHDDYNVLVFAIAQYLTKVQTATLVKVVACSNDGGLSPVGTVDVQPLVNMRGGTGTIVPHGQVFGLPYLRVQGGANAVIIDPEPGDIGIAVFASRDISSVKANKAQANPGSFRTFDWADGLYLGGVLNGVPTQFVQFEAAGITIKSPTKITLLAPEIDMTTSGVVNINGAIVSSAGEVTDALGKVLGTHVHSGVVSGGADTGPPV